MSGFVLFGAVLGSYSSRAPDIQLHLELSAGEYGLALGGLPVGIMLASLFLSDFVARLGAWRSVLSFGTAFAFCPFLAALSSSLPMLASALTVQGVMLALLSIGINLHASEVSKVSDPALVHRCHAIWGLALLAATFLGAQMVGAGIGFQEHLAGIGIASCMFLLVWRLVSPTPRGPSQASLPATFRPAFPNKGVLRIFLAGIAVIAVEGITRNWLIIHIRDSIGGPAQLAALSLSLLVLGQSAGRFAAGRLLRTFGAGALHRGTLFLCAVGCLWLAVTTHVLAALVATCLVGLGVSAIFPQSVAAAAALKTGTPTGNMAAFTLLQSLAVNVAPVGFGLMTESTGHRGGFLLLAVALAATLALSFWPARPIWRHS